MRSIQNVTRTKTPPIKSRRRIQILRREMRGKRERQSFGCGQLRAERAGAEQRDGHMTSLPRNSPHRLSLPRVIQVGTQLPQQRRKIVSGLTVIAAQGAHGVEVAARRAAQAEIDASG